MSRHIVVVENTADWNGDLPGATLVTAREYLAGTNFGAARGTRVINLCRSYRYLSTGYYCSLLAEARGHRVIPSVRTQLDLSRKSIYEPDIGDLHENLARRLREHDGDQASFRVYLGHCPETAYAELARRLFERFPCPVLEVELRRQPHWHISRLRARLPGDFDEADRAALGQGLDAWMARRWRNPRTRNVARYDLAILHNPADKLAPSNPRALKHFVRVGKKLGIDIDLIGRTDFGRLPEYDALFIRETTAINDHTFRFAKRAESEGMVVIDDPVSILRCTNKVYLAELLRTNNVATPRTLILPRDKSSLGALAGELQFPVVLKIPDGAFSLGVYKARDADELRDISARLHRQSDLILAQEYVYTEYDWRIGILNRQPVFACQYFMSRNHWQVVKHGDGGKYAEGDSRTLAVEDAPEAVVHTALRAANLIGDGLYGVDLKQNERGIYVIEVNDNPNLDAGTEDEVLGDELYRRILQEFTRRLDRNKWRRT